ncbi:sensor histidine kinase [Pontiella agarivorans]|uniref:Sensor histidine kinase n=1 Tax=Pontiella agarivorans TaxID=3038953 RepID=A0ABU5MWD0_9BACT|nr:sensor histidine kinase [Pontiella agarivorans]MDZ8118438.1 sensor histidine kinase [Pontiella agarivorans]
MGIVLLWSFLLLLGATVFGQVPITSIQQIRRLSAKQAGQGYPVQIEAQVLRVNPYKNHFFMHDGEVGIFVRGITNDSSVVKSLKAGDEVLVGGKTTAGTFVPDIQAAFIRVQGNRPRPEPMQIYNTDFVSPASDCKWGWIRGRLLSMKVSADQTGILLELIDVDSEEYVVHLPYSESNEQRIRELMFSFVKLSAVCGTVANENRQMIGRIFYAHSADDFLLSGEEWLLNTVDTGDIHELMRHNVSFNRPFRTHGIVLYSRGKEMVLRGERACLKVALNDPVDVQPGAEVSLTGFIWLQPVGPAFRAGEIEMIGKAERPVPVVLDLLNPLDPLMNYNLIQVDAELVEIKKDYADGGSVPQYTMRCRSAGEFFEARLPAGIQPEGRVEPGAMLRLSGICTMQRDDTEFQNLVISGFWLQLRGTEDIEVLSPPPWWTKARLLMLLGVVMIVTMISMVWIVILRKTVERQTRIIAEKVERESIHEERQRIARELHDNLEQGLAGAIFHLGGVRRIFRKSAERNFRHLDDLITAGNIEGVGTFSREWKTETDQNAEALEAVEHMLSHCSEESRTSILDLRGGLLEKMDLAEAVRVSLQTLEKERGVNVDIRIDGKPRRFAPAVERNVLLVIKEAVSNAVRHASAERIGVKLDFSAGLKAVVIDDGCGFDLKERAQAGRFGLQGMQERMQNIKGSLDIESEKDEGTVVTAEVAAV